ncbi:hypothetical protein [Escherichia coli]|uniref:hypothetical protein n=1 Tax=Escherichia coli TaxID=562 RepID=UPI0037DCC55B
MMQRLRDYQIIVGSSAEAFSGKPELQKKAKDATILEKLQFDATVQVSSEKSKTSNDIMQIRLTNLSKDIKEQFKVPGATIMIRAGYTDITQRDLSGNIQRKPDELPVVYLGTIEHTITTRRGNDSVTIAYASSDKVERAVTKVSQSFPPGTKVSDIIESLLKVINLPRGHIDLSSVKDEVYRGGLSVYGKAMNSLTDICDEWNLKFFVHDKKVNVVPRQPNGKSKVEVWDIFPNHIIDFPEGSYTRSQSKPQKSKTSGQKTKTKKDEKETVVKEGVTIKLHLDGRIKCGSHVRINEIEGFNGVYRVESLSHNMSYIGGDWSTELQLLSVGAN